MAVVPGFIRGKRRLCMNRDTHFAQLQNILPSSFTPAHFPLNISEGNRLVGKCQNVEISAKCVAGFKTRCRSCEILFGSRFQTTIQNQVGDRTLALLQPNRTRQPMHP